MHNSNITKIIVELRINQIFGGKIFRILFIYTYLITNYT